MEPGCNIDDQPNQRYNGARSGHKGEKLRLVFETREEQRIFNFGMATSVALGQRNRFRGQPLNTGSYIRKRKISVSFLLERIDILDSRLMEFCFGDWTELCEFE